MKESSADGVQSISTNREGAGRGHPLLNWLTVFILWSVVRTNGQQFQQGLPGWFSKGRKMTFHCSENNQDTVLVKSCGSGVVSSFLYAEGDQWGPSVGHPGWILGSCKGLFLFYFIIFVNIIIYMPICIWERGGGYGWLSEENMGGGNWGRENLYQNILHGKSLFSILKNV